jgi:magnesium transporter
MITILKSTDLGLEKIEALADGSWVNLVDPSSEDVAMLSHEYGIPADFLTSALDLDETARIEKEDEALLIVLRLPYSHGPKADIPYSTVPVGIVLTERVIVTICKVASPIIDELVASHPRGLSTTKRSRFFLVLFLVAAKKYLLYLREINKNVDVLEDRLQLSLRNREVLELLKYQKSLTYFTTALKANELMMGRLQRGRIFRMYDEDEDLLDDALTEIGQALEMTAISSGILSQMMDAFASIISNNLNVVMKFLTSVTILISLPTLIASIYGMNISLPFEHLPWPYDFAVPMGASLLIAGTVLVIFIRRDWL